MSLHYLENPTDSWAPLPDVDLADLHPEWDAAWPPTTLPPPRTEFGPHPLEHEMRPHERLYYVRGPELPAIPPPDDPRWDRLRMFFFSTIHQGKTLDHRHATWSSYTWKDRAAGDTEKISAGAWARDWDVNYWSPPWSAALPRYRKIGYEAWANGHPGGSHYDSALHCLEEGMRTGDPLAFQLWHLRTLHLASQGVYHKDGSGRYEKSSWCFAGDFYGDGYHQWSHFWPSTIFFYHMLTGELGDVALKVAEFTRDNDDGWHGFWGIRGCARYLRTLRAIHTAYPSLTQDEAKAYKRIEDVLNHLENRGELYFLNLGALWNVDGNVDVWQAWDWLHEAGAWAITMGWDELYRRMIPLARWLLNNAMTSGGMAAYYAGTSGHAGGHSPIYTAHALPFMGLMVEQGDLDQQALVNSANIVLNWLPIDGSDPSGRGIGMLGVRDNGTQARGGGPASCKTHAQVGGGLRPDCLKVAGL